MRREGEKQTYNDDYLLARSRYVSMLGVYRGQACGILRSFGEIFRNPGPFMDTPPVCAPDADLLRPCPAFTPRRRSWRAEGCLLQGAVYGAAHCGGVKDVRRILVVTGGFHTYGLGSLLEKTEGGRYPLCRETSTRCTRRRRACRPSIPWPILWRRRDALNGYASGMQSPGFYHQVWRELSCGGGAGKCLSECGSPFSCGGGKKGKGKGREHLCG